ncbi:hypothetical protein AAE485_13975 [Acidithiobacillus ferriphilus]|nr:hypothetical protein [Acidithiobacillus ferriphilus]WCE92897.1 hypothetical protein PJU76_07955 [Acidithiobacillus ferriphilus]
MRRFQAGKPFKIGHQAGEFITLHAATGLDEEGQPCFTITLPH